MNIKRIIAFLLLLSSLLPAMSIDFNGDVKKLIAHRGLWYKGNPQNSKVGIREALQSDLGGYECDIRETADGFLILNHDAEIGDIIIDKADLKDLQNANPEILPLLSDILLLQQQYPDKVMYAEIKSGNTIKILEEFKNYGISKNVIFKSFDKEICDSLITSTEIPVYLLSADSNLDFADLKQKGFSGVSLMFVEGKTSRELIDQIHSKGLKVAFWTVNDPGTAELLLEWGADHIVSDLPFYIGN